MQKYHIKLVYELDLNASSAADALLSFKIIAGGKRDLFDNAEVKEMP